MNKFLICFVVYYIAYLKVIPAVASLHNSTANVSKGFPSLTNNNELLAHNTKKDVNNTQETSNNNLTESLPDEETEKINTVSIRANETMRWYYKIFLRAQRDTAIIMENKAKNNIWIKRLRSKRGVGLVLLGGLVAIGANVASHQINNCLDKEECEKNMIQHLADTYHPSYGFGGVPTWDLRKPKD